MKLEEKASKFVSLLIVVALMLGIPTQGKKVIKLLAIGNSFSEDATEQNLYELVRAQGDSLVIGNAYIGGCPIERHWQNAQTDKPDYSYRKIVGGVKNSHSKQTLRQIIQDEPWDIITIQQASGDIGLPETYKNLNNLKHYVEKTALHPFRWAFHMTWAFQKNCKRANFVNYGWSQLKMYQALMQTVPQEAQRVGITDIIPAAFAVQKMREFVGDTITRDGFHMSYGTGRYTLACTWCEWLTGKSVVGNPFVSRLVTRDVADQAQKAAHQAVLWIKAKPVKPLAVINSEFFDFLPVMDNVACKRTVNGISFIKTQIPLSDSIQLRALPDFKVKHAEELKAQWSKWYK